MRTIDEILNTNPDRILYHYSSLDGLLGIVRSKSLWASNIYYFNDASEITYASDILKKVISDSKKSVYENQGRFLDEFSNWLDTFSHTIHQYFVFSLTEEGNLLSQWRGCTPKGKGMSIGFEPKELVRKVENRGLKIVKCVYEIPDQKGLAEELLERMIITFDNERQHYENKPHPPRRKYRGLLEKFREKILQIFSVIKNPSFCEEQEWRIISKYYARFTIPEIKYREGISMLVPYIEIDISPEKANEPMFHEVYMGPTPNHNLSHASLATFLSSSKACNKIISSSIPYREW
jgi:hypothetical protein